MSILVNIQSQSLKFFRGTWGALFPVTSTTGFFSIGTAAKAYGYLEPSVKHDIWTKQSDQTIKTDDHNPN